MQPTPPSSALLERIFPILDESFPPEIFYGYHRLAQNVLEKSTFHVVEHQADGRTVACLCYFDLPPFYFIEYLATDPQYRSGGIGGRMIDWLKAQGRPVVLESEPPHDEICRRRIAYYQRKGFRMQDYDYIMPPMGPGKRPEPMLLMSTVDLSRRQLEELERTLYHDVYRLPADHPGFRG